MKGMLDRASPTSAPRAARVERVAQINSDRSLTLSSQLAETENIDLPNTIMRLQMQQVGYEAALAATSKADADAPRLPALMSTPSSDRDAAGLTRAAPARQPSARRR